jgi:hypothetical protein
MNFVYASLKQNGSSALSQVEDAWHVAYNVAYCVKNGITISPNITFTLEASVTGYAGNANVNKVRILNSNINYDAMDGLRKNQNATLSMTVTVK